MRDFNSVIQKKNVLPPFIQNQRVDKSKLKMTKNPYAVTLLKAYTSCINTEKH